MNPIKRIRLSISDYTRNNRSSSFRMGLASYQLRATARVAPTFMKPCLAILLFITLLSIPAISPASFEITNEDKPEIRFGYSRELILSNQEKFLVKAEKELVEFQEIREETEEILNKEVQQVGDYIDNLKTRVSEVTSLELQKKLIETQTTATKLEMQLQERLDLLEARELHFNDIITTVKEFIYILKKETIGSIEKKDIYQLKDLDTAQMEIVQWSSKLVENRRKILISERDIKGLQEEYRSLKVSYTNRLKKVNSTIKSMSTDRLQTAFGDERAIIETEISNYRFQRDLLKGDIDLIEQKQEKALSNKELLQIKEEINLYLVRMGKENISRIQRNIVITQEEIDEWKSAAGKEREKSDKEITQIKQKRKLSQQTKNSTLSKLSKARQELETAVKDNQKILAGAKIELQSNAIALTDEELDHYDKLEDFAIQRTRVAELRAEIIELQAQLFSQQLTRYEIQSHLLKVRNLINELNLTKQNLYEERNKLFETLDIRRRSISTAQKDLDENRSGISRGFFSSLPRKIIKTKEENIEVLQNREKLVTELLALNKQYTRLCDETLLAMSNFIKILESEEREKRLWGRSTWAVSIDTISLITGDIKNLLGMLSNPKGTLIYTSSSREGAVIQAREIILAALTLILIVFLRIYLGRLIAFLRLRNEEWSARIKEAQQKVEGKALVDRLVFGPEFGAYLLTALKLALPYLLIILSVFILSTIFKVKSQIVNGVMWFLLGFLISRWLALTLRELKKYQILVQTFKLEPKEAVHFRNAAWLIILFSTIFLPVYLALLMGEYNRVEVLQFILYLYVTLVSIVLLGLLLRKKLMLSLIPDSEKPLAKKLKNLVDRYYLIVFGFFLSLLIIASPLVGYAYLAWFILSNLIFTALIFLSALALSYILKSLINFLIGPEDKDRMLPMDTPKARLLSGTLILVGTAITVGTAIIWISSLWGLPINFSRVGYALYYPLINIEGISISIASFAKLVFTLILAFVISKLIILFVERKVFPLYKFDIGVQDAISRSIYYTVLIIGFLYGLQIIGVGTSALSFLAAFIGIGIGFGAQNIIGNFISGLIIIFERPIKKGDYVVIGDIQGRIDEIRVRSTTVITRENVSLIVPNSEFVSNQVVNWSYNDPIVRIETHVGVSYGSDVQKVRKALQEVAKASNDILRYPTPEVHFDAFGDSTLNFSLLCWTNNPMNQRKIISDLNFLIIEHCRANDVEIAFPQVDLHIRTSIPLPFSKDKSSSKKES